MAKKLYEEETINKVYKAIEVHLELLKQSNIYLGNTIEKERLEDSINYLYEALSLLKPIENEIKELKRKAFLNYKKAKSELESYKKLGDIDKEILAEKVKQVDLYLKLYIAYKGQS